MIYLIDMDDVIVDFKGKLMRELKALHPTDNTIKLSKVYTSVSESFTSYEDDIRTIVDGDGFFRDLELIPGAVEGMTKLHNQGHDVFICSKPRWTSPTCASDKKEWVREFMPDFLQKKLILTWDKSVIQGDILIDDYLQTGVMKPSWTQWIYRKLYNEDVAPHLARFEWE